MKYLKDKNSRRRGVAIELAIGMLLIMVAMSTIIVTTTMIQIEKQKNSVNNLDNLITDIERIEYDQIGIYFEQLVNEETKTLISNDSDSPLNQVSFIYLTEDKTITDENVEKPSEIELDKVFGEIKDRIKENINNKFAVLIANRSLIFEVTVESVETIRTDLVSEDPVVDGDDITKVQTATSIYKISFTLSLKRKIGDNSSYNVLTVSNESIFNQSLTITSKYLKQYEDEPIMDENVSYTIKEETVNGVKEEIIELELKEGHSILLTGKEGIQNVLLTANLNIDQSDEENNDENKVENYFDVETQDVKKITAKEGSIGKSVTIELQYKKQNIVTEPDINEIIDEDGSDTENETIEEKTIKFIIKVVSEYTINNQDNNIPDEDPNDDKTLVIDESSNPIDPSTPVVPDEGTTDNDPEDDTQPKEIDFIIDRQIGINKIYTGDELKSIIYSYTNSNGNINENNEEGYPQRTHWEYN